MDGLSFDERKLLCGQKQRKPRTITLCYISYSRSQQIQHTPAAGQLRHRKGIRQGQSQDHSRCTPGLRSIGNNNLGSPVICNMVGYAYVNGRKGLVINIKTCSGQEDPLSSILLLFVTEPLNLYNAQDNRNLMLQTQKEEQAWDRSCLRMAT
jgi:hypothetical protein